MLKRRIIPCLDIDGGRVVKGVNFVGLKDVGDPALMAQHYEDQGADEIVLLDISATNEGRDTIYNLIERVASNLSIPVTVGGGIRSLSDFHKILACGADKVSINSSAVRNPDLIQQASDKFGSQCVVVAIDAKDFEVYINGGRENVGLNLIDWAKKCEELGAGEILLTSISNDGMQSGYDIEQTKAVADAVKIPVIASGGCGSIDDIIDVFTNTNCDAALVASLFHSGQATVGDVKMKVEGIQCKIEK